MLNFILEFPDTLNNDFTLVSLLVISTCSDSTEDVVYYSGLPEFSSWVVLGAEDRPE